MKKNLLALMIFLSVLLFLYGCVGPAPKAKTQLMVIKKAVANAKGEMAKTADDYKYVSPNEKAIKEELKRLKIALRLTTPEDDLASLKKSYALLTEKEVLKEFDGPPPSFTEEKIVDNEGRIRRIKFWIYSDTDPGGFGVWLKKWYSPSIKQEKTYVRFAISEGKVIDVAMGQSESELIQSIPGFLKLTPFILSTL